LANRHNRWPAIRSDDAHDEALVWPCRNPAAKRRPAPGQPLGQGADRGFYLAARLAAQPLQGLLIALLASGQINMREVDGWQTLATKPIDQPIDLAA
jgi:hypothetical protein